MRAKRQIGIIIGTLVFVLAMDASGSVACAGEYIDELIAKAGFPSSSPSSPELEKALFPKPVPASVTPGAAQADALSAFNAVNLGSIASSLSRLSRCRSGVNARTYAARTYTVSGDPITNAVNLDALAGALIRTRCRPPACPVADPIRVQYPSVLDPWPNSEREE